MNTQTRGEPSTDALRLERSIRAAVFARLAEQGDDIPMPTQQGVRIANLAQDTNTDPKTLSHAVTLEPVLATRALRLANSAYYRRSGPVTHDIWTAVRRLGNHGIRDLVFTEVMRSVPIQSKRLALESNALWLHSVATACAAHQRAKGRPGVEQHLAFLAGLLHDIGLLVGICVARTELAAGRLSPEVTDQEIMTALGPTHMELGGMLGRAWGLPVSVLTVIRRHHSPSSELDELTQLVKEANALVEAMGFGVQELRDELESPATEDEQELLRSLVEQMVAEFG